MKVKKKIVGGKGKSAPKAAAEKPAAKVSAKATAAANTGAFTKKNHPPAAAEFAARLPLALGKRFEGVRGLLLKQKGTAEDVFFYGPKAGWALRYIVKRRPLCSLLILGEQPLGILSLDEAATAAVDWPSLSPVAQQARKAAHGSPAQLWLDVPLEGSGAADFKALLKAKLGAQMGASPAPRATPPPPPAASHTKNRPN